MKPFPKLSGPAGAAFLLGSAPKEDVIFIHPMGSVCLRESAPYVTVELNRKPMDNDVRSDAWRVVQESLDILAANGQTSLVTLNGDAEYLFWLLVESDYVLTMVNTGELKWSMQGQGTVGNQPAPPESKPFFHHNILRYYRISQCTPDLFDAFRNAYMGFECLISSVSPKEKGESELKWLKRVVNGELQEGVPEGVNIDALLTRIYLDGRNPLFHAKTDQTFHPPQGKMREEIQAISEELIRLLIALTQYKYGNDVIRGWAWMHQDLEDAQSSVTYKFDEVQFPDGGNSISEKPEIELVQFPRRFDQIWGKISVKKPVSLNILRNVQFLLEGQLRITLHTKENILLEGVRDLVFEITTANRNIHQPRSFREF